MRSKQTIGLSLLMGIALSILGVNDIFSAEKEFSVIMTDYVWEKADMKYSAFSSTDDFITEVEYYIKAISEFTSQENWFEVYKERHGDDYVCDIEFELTNGISHVESGYYHYLTLKPNVYLNGSLFEHDLAPIAHETTHIILPYYSSLSLREGFASYCQDMFGKNPSVFNYGMDVHTYANCYLVYESGIFDKIFEVIGTTDLLQSNYASEVSRQAFYIQSYSFTKFLIDAYGIDNFLKLYESDNLECDYKVVCGKGFTDVKSEWRKFLETYPESVTIEDIEAYISELYTEHGYH